MKRVKKLLSLILLATILFTDIAPVAVLAVENAPQPKTVALDAITPKGNIEIETHLALPVRNTSKNNITFKISNTKDSASLSLNAITKAKDGIYDDTIELGNQKDIRIVATKRDFNGNLLSGIDEENNIVYLSINLYSLNKGKYTLEFSGDKFVTYKTDVTLDDTSKRVSFSNEKGMFELGDVNGDNKVDTKDSDAIDKSIGTKDADYDLNLDGVVDIADLNYVTAIINGQSGKVKIENTSAIIDTNNIDLSMTGTSVSSGNIENIFTDEGMVTLKPEKEAPISDDNPVSLDINLEKNNQPVEMEEIRLSVGENMPTDGTVIVETQSGEKIEKPIEDITKEENGVYKFTEVADENVITISLGKQVAVKKVTIKITGTKTNNLADIAKVEFLNNVKTEAPKPADLSIPKNIKIDESESEKLTVSFSNVPNVTGYEIKIVGKKMESGKIFQTTYNKFTIEDLKNYQTYKIYVQAVNGEWKTGWSKEYTGTPTTKVKPPKPDDVSATGTFSGIDFKWKDMDDTLTYNLYYKKVGDKEFKKYNDKPIEKNSYELRGLEPATEYQAYITGVNPNGEGPASQIMKAKTLKKEATITPKYKLINDTVVDGKTNHIKDVIPNKGIMTNNNKFAMVDDDYNTYFSFNDWTAGSHGYQYEMPTTILDKTYTMNEFVITVPDEFNYSFKTGTYDKNSAQYKDTLVFYWNTEDEKNSQNAQVVPAVITTKKDKNQRPYYVLKLEKPIEANAIQLGLTNAQNQKSVQVAELKLYEYDSLVDDVANLFTDDLRIELAEGVDQTKIDNLRNRANQKDHDEYSPYRDSVLMDLEYAEKILNDKNASKDVITMNSEITNAYNGNKGFAMTLNDYQPLGIVAKPGETLNVYVGSKGNVNAELIYTQHYAQPSAWSKSVKLTKGQNIIKIDKITSVDEDEAEGGGSLYVRYTGTPDTKNPIKLRVSGGHKIPVLDTSLLDNENAKKTAIKTYIDELKNYNASLKETYSKEGKTFKNDTSVLGATEIATKYGLFSVSSVAVENAINAELTNENDKINRLYESTEAFDEMMLYFYRQKGFSSDVDAKDANGMTKSRINIRYMRMFYGAFMYAGGFHLGIEYGSIAGLIQANRHSDDKTGYFGWGISHEVGHQINEKSTVFAEVTNNIYALLAQSSNDKDETRLENSKIYDKIYNKVTSHTTGRDQNVFVQLGMYWQLHLAYDDNKTFTDKDSIFAKVNKIAREYKNTNNYSRDELTILFASMAAKKNLIDYFATWGLKPSSEKAATLKNEIEQIEIVDGKKIEKENKAIYYLNDEARRYRLKNLSNLENAKISNDVTVDASITEASSEDKRVTINLGVNKEENKILGYEILRNGTSVGFVTKDNKTFVDNIGAENNRAYIYEVVAYDYLLNKTKPTTLKEVKISHKGTVVKDTFSIESNVKEQGETIDLEDAKMDYSKLSINKLIDGKDDTYFNGNEKITTINHGDKVNTTTDNNDAYVIISLNDQFSLTGIEYKAATDGDNLMNNTITKYKISVSSDKNNWQEVKTGTFNLTKENNYTDTIYFTNKGSENTNQLWTYDCSYVKIESVGNKNGLSGKEIDLISPPNDNIDITTTKDSNTPDVGKLTKDFCYATDAKDCENGENTIKAGSVIFKGNYTGSPTFNILTIADATNENNVYDGYQLLFAELDDNKAVYEVAEGTWMYVMTEEEYESMKKNTSNVRAYLYRVNDYETKDGETIPVGQRLTSTSLSVGNLKDYSELPSINITNEDLNKK